jgi:hypothetical protein
MFSQKWIYMLKFFIAVAFLLCSSAFSQQANISSTNGRYAIGQISQSRQDQFVLDTQTGRVWRVTCKVANAPLCERFVLKAVGYGDETDSETVLPDESTKQKYLHKSAVKEFDEIGVDSKTIDEAARKPLKK